MLGTVSCFFLPIQVVCIYHVPKRRLDVCLAKALSGSVIFHLPKEVWMGVWL